MVKGSQAKVKWQSRQSREKNEHKLIAARKEEMNVRSLCSFSFVPETKGHFSLC